VIRDEVDIPESCQVVHHTIQWTVELDHSLPLRSVPESEFEPTAG
jgi:hypothetical protein